MSTNLFLSLELMYLLKWLIEHDKSHLRSLINHALKTGLGRQLHELPHAPKMPSNKVDEMLNSTFLELLTFLEGALHDGLEHYKLEGELSGRIGNILAQVNVKNIDSKTMMQSIDQARHELEKKESSALRQASEHDAKRALMHRMLHNWKPTKDEPVN